MYTQEEIEVHSNILTQLCPGVNYYEAFWRIVRKNLRIVISLDHRSSTFSLNCAQNPALFSKCQIIWLEDYSQKSQDRILGQKIKGVSQSVLAQFEFVHKLNGGCPKDFFNMIDVFLSIYQEKQEKKHLETSHLSLGLQKLQEANDLVDKLSSEAQVKEQELSIKDQEANDALESMSSKMTIANQKKQEIEQKQKFV